MSALANPVLTLMREDDISHDPWGTAMAWAFAVAEVLYAAGEDVPDEMGFSPSPFVQYSNRAPEEWPDAEVWHLLNGVPAYWVRAATVADIQFAGRVLARYLAWCRAAGRAY